MTQERKNHAQFYFYENISETSVRGCLRVDHQGHDEKEPRQPSDMTLFSEHNKDRLAPNVPKDRLIPLMTRTLAGLRSEEGEIAIDVTVPGGKVTKHVSEAFETIICDAYNDPMFINQNHPLFTQTRESIMSFRDNPYPSRMVTFPGDMDESSFRFMSDDEFVSFHLIHDSEYNKLLPVTIIGVRRAEKELDPRVVKEVKFDRRF